MCSLFRTRETFSSCAPTNTPFPVDLRLHRTARRAYNIGYSGGQIPALARYIQHTILDRDHRGVPQQDVTDGPGSFLPSALAFVRRFIRYIENL